MDEDRRARRLAAGGRRRAGVPDARRAAVGDRSRPLPAGGRRSGAARCDHARQRQRDRGLSAAGLSRRPARASTYRRYGVCPRESEKGAQQRCPARAAKATRSHRWSAAPTGAGGRVSVADEVLYEVDGRVATITLNRPQQRNAVSPELANALGSAMAEFEGNPEVWVAVLTGVGGIFSAGADLKAIAAGRVRELSVEPGGFAGFVRYPRTKPVIAAVRGFALAGGTELALACDLIVAGTDTAFGLPEVTRGIIAAAGGLLRLPRVLPRARALELIMTGDRLPAGEALRLGMVNAVVDPDDVLATARGLADRICANAPIAVRESLGVARRAQELTEDEGWRISGEAADRVRQTEDAAEGPRAFAEKREPRWTGR